MRAGRPSFHAALVVVAASLALGADAVPAVFAQENAPLEERMSDAEFKAYGLGKLSAAERAGLNAWLQQQMRALAPNPSTAGSDGVRDPQVGFRSNERERVAVKARLDGTFSGWSGKTVFKLDNGQEWQQVEPGSSFGQRIENAEVTIKPKVMGTWLLVVERCQCRIGVTRIK